jgi:hypothetical protein
MKRLFLTGIAALFLATGTAHAAEVKVLPEKGGSTAVVLQGQIYAGDNIDFNKATQAIKGDVFLFLDSRGGEIYTAISIGNFVRMNQWTTIVVDGDMCNSACALIWFSGVHRILGSTARIGVHSAGKPDAPGERNEWGNFVVAKYLHAIGIPDNVISRWQKTDPCCIDYIDYPEARSLGLLSEYPNWIRKGNRSDLHRYPFLS